MYFYYYFTSRGILFCGFILYVYIYLSLLTIVEYTCNTFSPNPLYLVKTNEWREDSVDSWIVIILCLDVFGNPFHKQFLFDILYSLWILSMLTVLLHIIILYSKFLWNIFYLIQILLFTSGYLIIKYNDIIVYDYNLITNIKK